jgi:class 3 adenylate cyclase
MHRELKELLPSAKGESRLVVVVFLDVRGFSSFAKIAESSEAALFLRSMYVKILDNYFPEASFFKPTGDGLLIILDYDESNLTAAVNSAVRTSLQLVEDFANLTQDDPMINFEVPDSIGMGLARGAATALISKDKVLDYSGRPLNLASRLMDLARPRGVVFSDMLGWALLEDALSAQFVSDKVYVKGIAEDQPMAVHIQETAVSLPESSKRPINRYDRKTTDPEELTFKKLKERDSYIHLLAEKPAVTNNIVLYVRYPKPMASGRRHKSMSQIMQISAEYTEREGKHYARIDYNDVQERLTDIGVKDTWPVILTVEYSASSQA